MTVLGDTMSPAAFYGTVGGHSLSTLAAKGSGAAAGFVREAAPWLLVSGPILTGESGGGAPTLDRFSAPLENMTRPAEGGGLPVTAIAAAVVGLGVVGLVAFKLRKRKR